MHNIMLVMTAMIIVIIVVIVIFIVINNIIVVFVTVMLLAGKTLQIHYGTAVQDFKSNTKSQKNISCSVSKLTLY